jgi:protein SCO1/2
VTRGVRTTVLLSLAFVAIVVAMLVTSVLREPVLSEEQLRESGTILLPKPRELAPFELTDHHGQPFTRERLEGHWTLLYFGFTSCPDICPVTLSVLAQAEQALRTLGGGELAEGYHVVLVTVDPEKDDAATLGKYVEAFSPRFVGVTGTREEIAELATQLNVAFMKVPTPDGGYTVDHTGNIVIVNPRGHYHAFVRVPHERDKIVATYRSLVAGW